MQNLTYIYNLSIFDVIRVTIEQFFIVTTIFYCYNDFYC